MKRWGDRDEDTPIRPDLWQLDKHINLYEEGYGVSKNWEEGLKLVPPGTYSVRYTTNCRGITVLNVNTTPFRVNFDIPPFTLTVN